MGLAAFTRKLFNLYPGEEKNALVFALLAFLWSLGSYCGVTLSDGMFLEHVGADGLPIAYLLTALGLFGTALLFLYAFNHFNALRIYYITLILGAIGYFLVILYLPDTGIIGSYAFWLSVKVFCNILAVVLTTCFWFFLDQYFNLQNAKRLYSLFNASIFFGNACGGAFLAFSLNYIGMSGISFGIIALFLLTCVWVFVISKRTPPLIDEAIEGSSAPEKEPLKLVLKGFLKSRFTILLMIFYFLIQLVNVTTEYTYMQSFDAYFDIPRTDNVEVENRLTIFLGECTAWIALANMFFGFFFYSRIVTRFGINNIVGISPIFFLITFISWGFTSALLVAILGLIVVEGISYTVDENNSNLLLGSVPTQLKNKARVAIDSFFEPLGMLVSALIFIFFTVSSQTIGLILTLVTIIFVFFIRTQYPKALLFNLLQNALHFERKARQWVLKMSKKERHSAKLHLLSRLKEKDETAQLLSCKMLLEFKDPKILPRILSCGDMMSMKSKVKLIQLLDDSLYATSPLVLDTFKQWIRKISHSSLKSSILLYLAKRSLLNPSKIPLEITTQDLTAKGAYILTHKMKGVEELLQSSRNDEISMGLYLLGLTNDASYIHLIIPFLKHASVRVQNMSAATLANLCGPSERWLSPLLINLLDHTTQTERRASLLIAIGKLESSTLVPHMILKSLHYRPSEKRLIENIVAKIGLRTVPCLLAITKDTNTHDRCRILSGRILGRLALPQLRANLFEIIEQEIQRAYFYFFHSFETYALENHDLKMLQETLYTGFESVIDFIIQLLGVAGEVENSELLSHSLHSKNPKTRGQAIETVEKTCESKIFHLIKPLIDDRPIEDKLRLYSKRKLNIANLDELLDALEYAPSTTLQVIALTLKAQINAPNWRSNLRKHMKSGDEIFHHFAYELLQSHPL